jgi:hypothetical protein
MEVGPVRGSVAGRPVRILVDTSQPGISASATFLTSSGLSADRGIVPLRDVTIAGRVRRNVFARVIDDDRSDLFVGLQVFPRAVIAISRSNAATIRRAGCHAGAKLLPYDGTGEVVGPDAKGPQIALLDTRHKGPPETHARVLPLVPGQRTCEATSRVIAFAGKVYGHDRFCNVSPGLMRHETSFNIVVGLDSLEARAAVLDLAHNVMCLQ